MLQILSTAFLAAVFFAILLAAAWAAPGADSAPAKRYPVMPGLDGRPLDPAQWQGKVTVVNFFATWCGFCRLEIPHLVEFNRRFAAKGVILVGLALDPADDRELVTALAAKLGVNYRLAFARRGDVAAFGGAPYVPTTLILDRTGKIISRHVGIITAEQLATRVEKALKAVPAGQLKSSMVPAARSVTRPMTAALTPRP